MSDNLNRSIPDFSKYDSMSIGELEEILRADVQDPKQDDSDIDEIIYVMEVLAKIRRQNGIAGKTALEAYQEFQQHYLPMVEEENIESVPVRKETLVPFRWIATIAASLVLVFTLTTSVNAFGWKDIWDAVARWAGETFCFSMGVEADSPNVEDSLEYVSLQEALEENKKDSTIVPTWIPKGYELTEIHIDRTPVQESFIAIYLKDKSMLKIYVQLYLFESPERIELSEDVIEIYTVLDTDYFIISNNKLNQAAWTSGSYECYLAGDLSFEEIKQMIDSIGKG